MSRGWLLGAIGVSLVSASCVQTPDFAKNTADVLLRLTKIQGAGGDGGTASDFLISDVINCTESDGCSTFNDNATLNFELTAKNPLSTVTGAFNDVQLTSYSVRYTRTDGRNIEGVDVPFGFSGSMATQVPAGGTGAAAIVVVRHTAKAEPPLNGISNGGFFNMLYCTAHITVFGQTINGKNVSTEGSLEISFGDFANE